MEKTLLIIDDVGYTRKMIKQTILKDIILSEIQIIEAETAVEALHTINNKNIDLVICDINLPDRSGLDLYNAVKKEKPKLIFIFITALELRSIIPKLRKSKINKDLIFTKPIDFKELRRMTLFLLGID